MSVEAADIYKHEQENGVAVGYKLPENKSDAYFRLFKVLLDASLDSTELEKAYKRICRKKFSTSDKYGNAYTLAVVNVKFNYIYKQENGKPVNLKSLREHFYANGFYLDGIHYVRYKRSAGSSREGKCLFIDERLLRAMNKWSECGLKPQKDLAAWESYKALSLSSIKGTVEIPLNGILFVPDYKSVFQEKVVSVESKDGKLSAKTKQTQITNDIWDGESLLDESVFQKYYADKHMLLLRGKFFKSCAFRTKLQKWFADKHITLHILSPMKKIVLPYHEPKKGSALTKEEKTLVDFCIEHKENKASSALLVLLYFGLRRSELKTISVENEMLTCTTSKTKMGRSEVKRSIPFTPVFKRVLPYVDFEKAKHTNVNTIYTTFKRLLPNHHTHELRYNFITRANVRVQKGNYEKFIVSKQSNINVSIKAVIGRFGLFYCKILFLILTFIINDLIKCPKSTSK